MLGKIFGRGLDFVLKYESAARISAGAAAASGISLGMQMISAQAPGIGHYATIGGAAAASFYIAYNLPFWGAARFLRETGKGIGYLFRKKENAPKQGNPLVRIPLEHPIATSAVITAGSLSTFFWHFGGEMYRRYEYGVLSDMPWRFGKIALLGGPVVFAASYMATYTLSLLFHPRNSEQNAPLLKAKACELMGMEDRAVRILEGVEHPKREHFLSLAYLHMRRGDFGSALTCMRDSYELVRWGLFNPSPFLSNLAEADGIGSALSRAGSSRKLENIVEAAVRVHGHSRQRSEELWDLAVGEAGAENMLELSVARAYFLDSVNDETAMEEWERIVARAVEECGTSQIGDYDVLTFDFGTIMKTAFALKGANEGKLAKLEAQMELTQQHRKLVSTDEFLTAEAITIVRHGGKYYLAMKYARGTPLAESGTLEDYKRTARYLAREHALMPLRPGKYNAEAKLAGSLTGKLSDDTFSRFMQNTGVIFYFGSLFPDVFARDGHPENWSRTPRMQIVALDIEDKGNNKPPDEFAKLSSHSGSLAYDEKEEMAEHYAAEYHETAANPFECPRIFFSASMGMSIGAAARYACSMIGRGEERESVSRGFLHNAINDARGLLESNPGCMPLEHARQLEKLADIAEKEIIPQITMA